MGYRLDITFGKTENTRKRVVDKSILGLEY